MTFEARSLTFENRNAILAVKGNAIFESRHDMASTQMEWSRRWSNDFRVLNLRLSDHNTCSCNWRFAHLDMPINKATTGTRWSSWKYDQAYVWQHSTTDQLPQNQPRSVQFSNKACVINNDMNHLTASPWHLVPGYKEQVVAEHCLSLEDVKAVCACQSCQIRYL